MVVIAVAMDVQGAEAARSYAERAGATYPVLVDSENRLGRLLGFRAVPNTYLVDAEGRFLGRVDGRQAVERWFQEGPEESGVPLTAGRGDRRFQPSPEDLRRWLHWAKDDPEAWVELLDRLFPAEAEGAYQEALQNVPNDPQVRFRYGSFLLRDGRREEALEQFRVAFRLDPENWIIRKQVWALEHPERFYRGAIDWDWQRQRIQEEQTSP
ncbi:MAG: hypothetical protein KatS3mg115_1251 [Candidatus Poribacteria bacterium]|nr:MAG: hypothetical protein KatS3mg115_1251 [Candidatus Poribacteria bacterium]